MQLFSFKFFMLIAKNSCQEKKHLLINMQIYARNSCAGQKHRGRWRLIKFAPNVRRATHLCSPGYTSMFVILCRLINGEKRVLNVRSAGSYQQNQ